MQDINFEHIKINLDPRPTEFKPLSKELEVKFAYLGAIAKKKRHAASLIVNLHNSSITGADMNGLIYYCRGESCNTLKSSVWSLIQTCAYIESHEIYGSDFVDGLIERWGFRQKKENLND